MVLQGSQRLDHKRYLLTDGIESPGNFRKMPDRPEFHDVEVADHSPAFLPESAGVREFQKEISPKIKNRHSLNIYSFI